MKKRKEKATYDSIFFLMIRRPPRSTLFPYTDALPIFRQHMVVKGQNRDTAWYSMLDREWPARKRAFERWLAPEKDRKSTRLNSSHANISYAVFCLKKNNPHTSFLAYFFFSSHTPLLPS